MAKRSKKAKRKPSAETPFRLLIHFTLKWAVRGLLAFALFVALALLLYRFVNPPTTPYIFAEARRLGGVERNWVPLEEIAPVMARAAVAAEDANFCTHWGFDMAAIRAALDAGGARGASTISQQVVKNAYLWHGRSWSRPCGVMRANGDRALTAFTHKAFQHQQNQLFGAVPHNTVAISYICKDVPYHGSQRWLR
jgi:monofunctional biosynthetic peptidoglycan transglycosylase